MVMFTRVLKISLRMAIFAIRTKALIDVDEIYDGLRCNTGCSFMTNCVRKLCTGVECRGSAFSREYFTHK